MSSNESGKQGSAPAQPVWERPQPMPSRDSAFYWEGAERGEFLGQRCAECKIFRHPPRPMCPDCQCLEWEATPLSGRGVIHAWMQPVHPKMPMFEDPLICILVDLEEGIRIFSNLYECEVSEVKNGMPVEVFFAPTAGGKAVPVFRPANPTEKENA
ncbi:MAG: Zn-ribbon domain-containing OB-fold protein [Myxococcota bacterium]